jgi:NDMA-dependent alcohol dehydrogenase
VVCSFIPSCGHCRFCSTGQQNLCDLGKYLADCTLADGTFRFHLDGEDLGGMCMLGTFSQYATISEYSCVLVADDVPLETAVLVGCGVPTGWGSSVNGAAVRPGDTVVVFGVGGVGVNAVQGARHAGAKNIVAVDPVAMKREKAEDLGATHTAATAEEARQLVVEGLTAGVGADSAIITVGVVTNEVVDAAVDIIRKGGRVVITAIASPAKRTVHVSGAHLTLYQKSIHGLLFGGCNPIYDIRKMIDLYRAGQYRLDELITARYRLEDINRGYQDLLDGKNLRGIIVHEH